VLEVYQNLGLGSISLEECEKSRKQSKLVQVGGPQVKREPPYLCEKVIDDGPRLLEPGLESVGRRVSIQSQQ
jgi:hypothetical protein